MIGPVSESTKPRSRAKRRAVPLQRAVRAVTLPAALFEVDLGALTLPVKVKRNPAARRYTLRLDPHSREAVLTMPPRASVGAAQAFIAAHRVWLENRLATLPPPRPLRPGGTVPVRGRLHRIVHRPHERGTVWVEEGERMPNLVVAGERVHLPRRITDWLKKQARRDLEKAVARYARLLGVRWTRIQLRDPKGRWGSCSAGGGLSFSWRLILAPPHVLDYLAAHEVTHLKEMSHAPRFWRLLESIHPGLDEAESWLKHHGATLHAVGAAETI